MSIQFNQSALEAWVALCNEEGELKRQGAATEVLEAMRVRVAKALIAIIQEAQSHALLEQILGTAPQPRVAETTELEVEDPATN